MSSKKAKIIVILGTTASGKTTMGVKFADEFNGEIVSADSRQVYRGMDIGTGKDLEEYEFNGKKIPYHLIDVVDPNKKFSLADYQILAYKAIDDILERGKLPIIVGGSGLYIQSIVDGYQLSNSKPDKRLRAELEKKSAIELFEKLKKINPGFANKLNNSDKNNKRRLIRYIEINSDRTKPDVFKNNFVSQKKYNFLLIGLTWPTEILYKRIHDRLIERLEKEDMISEVDHLHESGVSWKRLESFGLEYKFIAWYLQEKIDYETMVEKLFIAIRQFAKRQKSWFKRWEKQGAKIHWSKELRGAKDMLKDF